MPQVFHRSANAIARFSLVLVLSAAMLLFVLLLALQRSAWFTGEDVVVQQPIQFSHERHVAGNGLDCRYCHTSVERSAFAGYPSTQTCLNCHSQVLADSPYFEPVRASARAGVPLTWHRVYNLADHVYFDHSRHVAKGVGCVTCHGRVDRMPLMRKAVSLHMAWCLDCHEAPERSVRPREQVFSMTWEPPADDAERLGRELVQRYGIRRLTDCYTCHR